MTNALIGHTGFVGGALHRAGKFDVVVNSASIGEIKGKEFDLVVCAGVRSAKWWANANADEDVAQIAKLTATLETIRAKEFILISTIDVYPESCYGRWADEDEPLNLADHTQAYGHNRLALEEWALSYFSLTRIVRLPALFGEGLKKNILFDLLHSPTPPKLNPNSVYQWYSLRWLVDNIKTMRETDIRVLNMFPEPIALSDILMAFFLMTPFDMKNASLVHYDIHTKYNSGYIATRAEVLSEMAEFIISERLKCHP